MEKLQLFESKSGRVSLDFNLESKAFEINSWKYQTWQEFKTALSLDFKDRISILVDDEIKEAEKKLQYYKDELNNDYPVFYYENTDKI
jgi:hypothetical protein